MQQETLTRRVQVVQEDAATNIRVDGVFAGGWNTDIPNEDLPYYCSETDCKWLVLHGEGDVDVIDGWHEFVTCECEDWSSCCLNEQHIHDFFPADPNRFISDCFCADVEFEDWNENMSTDELIDEVNDYFGSGDWDDHWDYSEIER